MKKVLIIQTAFIGDAILSTALVESISEHSSDFQIDVLVRQGNEVLFENNPHVLRVLSWNKKSGKYKSLYALSKEIRKSKYDVVINLQRFASSGFLIATSKSKVKIGYQQNPFSFFFTHKFKHEIGNGTHEVQRNLSLANTYFKLNYQKPKLYFSLKEESRIEELNTGDNYVTLSPSSVWKTKQLPINKWIEIIKLINPSWKIFLLGGSGDRELNDSIISQSSKNNNQLVNLAGQLNLKESALLMKKARINHVNDSAPLHLASAVNANTRAYFCSTIPDFGFGPLAENSQVVEVSEKLDCRPCGLHGHRICPKGHFKCGNNITILP